jgi:serine/threonine-protein kinase
MSPEQSLGLEADSRSDLYAFGVILYQMLSGKFPYPERGLSALTARLQRPPDPIATHVPELPDSLTELLHRCLEIDVEKRFQTAAELRLALEKLEGPPPGSSKVLSASGSLAGVRLNA